MKPPEKKPCRECPWRLNSLNGWLGPYTADEWLMLAHSDEVIACHLTIPEGFDDDQIDLLEPDYMHDGDLAKMTQCSGAAIYRRHVAKSPRNPNVVVLPADPSIVFDSPVKFREHHGRKPR